MKLSLSQKLVVAFLGLTLLVLTATLGLARWSFEQGFLDYVNALERARERWTGTDEPPPAVAGLAEGLPFADGCFDGIFGIDTLHHLAAPQRAFAEMLRVLRPGGMLAFAEPNPRYPVNWLLVLLPVERGILGLRRPRLRRWFEEPGWSALELGNLDIFCPSWPSSLGPAFDRLERLVGRSELVRAWSTTRTIVAQKDAR